MKQVRRSATDANASQSITIAEKVRNGKTVLSRVGFLVFGGLFGFLLSRAGATTYDFYPKLFLFQDLQLLWVIAVAAGVGLVGTTILRLAKTKTLIGKQPLNFKGKPWMGSLIPGSLIFGIGWGLAGACPGTALAMLGEGKLGSIATIAGFFIGTWIYGAVRSRKTISSDGSATAEAK